jgi:MFS transporter, ACS family, allantoate permease
MPSTFASQVSTPQISTPNRQCTKVEKFSSQIIKGFGFTTLQTTLVSTCPAAVIQLGTFLGVSYIASKYRNIRLWLSMAVSVPPLIGAALLHSLPESNQAGRLAGYYLTYTYVKRILLELGTR